MNNYTKKFYDLSLKDRVEEYEKRRKNNDPLEIEFSKASEVMPNVFEKLENKEIINAGAEEVFKIIDTERQNRDHISAQPAVAAPYDQHVFAITMAEAEYTKICYLCGLNPETIITTYIDARFKEDGRMFQQSFVFAKMKEGYGLPEIHIPKKEEKTKNSTPISVKPTKSSGIIMQGIQKIRQLLRK